MPQPQGTVVDGSVRDKTLRVYQGAFHDLLNDFDKSVVMEDIRGWIRARLSPVA